MSSQSETKPQVERWKMCRREGNEMVCEGYVEVKRDEKGGGTELQLHYSDEKAMETASEAASKKVRLIHDPKIKVEKYPVTEEKAETTEPEGNN